jgi:hypothetical protein
VSSRSGSLPYRPVDPLVTYVRPGNSFVASAGVADRSRWCGPVTDPPSHGAPLLNLSDGIRRSADVRIRVVFLSRFAWRR